MVIIPEYVARHWWERLLYNQTSKRLRAALLGRPDTVVAAVPYRREMPAGQHKPAAYRPDPSDRPRPIDGDPAGPDGPARTDGPEL